MASIQLDIDVATTPEAAWDAVRDFGAVHQRLVPGFLTDSRLEGDDRLVTFFTGAVARERLVSVDDARRRLVYSVVDSPLGATHHQASVEVVDGDGTVLRWTTDVLPSELAPTIRELMERAAVAMTATLRTEGRATERPVSRC